MTTQPPNPASASEIAPDAPTDTVTAQDNGGVNAASDAAVSGNAVSDTVSTDISETVAAAVIAVPGVAATHSGMFGEVGTYLPGRRVPGIRIDDGAVQVHVVIDVGVPATDVAARIRAAVTAVTGPTAVHVHIEDVLPQISP